MCMLEPTVIAALTATAYIPSVRLRVREEIRNYLTYISFHYPEIGKNKLVNWLYVKVYS